MKRSIIAVASLVAAMLATPVWGAVYYNDCVHGGSPPNATIYSAYMQDGGGFETPTGYLRDYDTGVYSSIYVQMTGANITGSISGPPASGTDAYNDFNGKVNLGDWSTSYNNSSLDWYYQVTFTGLDPTKTYEFVTTANRNDSGYAGDGSSSRWTKFSIIGADSYTNASSAGVVEISSDVVEFNTGYNTLNGYVAGWNGITAADGSFTVISQNVGASGPGNATKSYGMEGFMLVESAGSVPEPTTLVVWSLLGGLAIGLRCWRRRKPA